MEARSKRSIPVLTEKQLYFAKLVGEGRDEFGEICRRVGISQGFGSKWQKNPLILARIVEHQDEKFKSIDPETIGRRYTDTVKSIDEKVKSRALANFEFFRREFLGSIPVKCQKRWAEWIEADDRSVILCPREHGKSRTAVEYIIWRIIKDRTIRVLILSRSQYLASLWVGKVKRALAGNRKIIDYFGTFKPPGKPDKWSQSELLVEGANEEEPHPTLVSLGITSALYGLRADLIICDDIVDDENAGTEELRAKLADTYFNAVENILDDTLGRSGKMIVIGTRKHPLDLYDMLMSTQGYRVHVEKAVLDWGGARDHWRGKILCPELYNAKGGIKYFRAKRDSVRIRRFNREFQNDPSDDTDVIVPSDAFDKDKNKDHRRSYGDALPHWVTIINADPGTTEKGRGSFAVTIEAFNPDFPLERYLVDWYDDVIPSEEQPRMLCALYQKYGAAAMRIETNACQKYLMDAVRREGRLGGVWRGVVWPPRMINVHPQFTHIGINDPKAGLEVVGHAFDEGRWSLPYATDEDREKTDEFIAKICGYSYREHKRAHLLMTLWFGENEILERTTSRVRQCVIFDRPDYLQLVRSV